MNLTIGSYFLPFYFEYNILLSDLQQEGPNCGFLNACNSIKKIIFMGILLYLEQNFSGFYNTTSGRRATTSGAEGEARRSRDPAVGSKKHGKRWFQIKQNFYRLFFLIEYHHSKSRNLVPLSILRSDVNCQIF